VSRRSVTIAAAMLLAAAAGAEARGPWHGQVVDAETGQPIAGVVVLASWTVWTAGWPHPTEEFFGVAEVVTDTDGRFTIPARDLRPLGRPGAIVGPELRMFKAGYGLWRYQGSSPYPQTEDPVASRQRAERELAKLERDGTIFELPPVTTRKERLHVLGTLGVRFAPELIPRWVDAYSRERVFLGLTPCPSQH